MQFSLTISLPFAYTDSHAMKHGADFTTHLWDKSVLGRKSHTWKRTTADKPSEERAEVVWNICKRENRAENKLSEAKD